MSCVYTFVEKPPCATCCRPYEPVRIGISAHGWAFLFDNRPDLGLATGKAWIDLLSRPEVTIMDEYGRVQEKVQFFDWIARKREDMNHGFPVCPDGYAIHNQTGPRG